MKQVLLLSLILLSCGLSSAQERVGLVLDSLSHQPIEYANMVVLAMPDSAYVSGTTTDAEGRFTLPDMGANCIIQVRCLGYRPKTLSAQEDLSHITLQTENYSLDEVVVSTSLFSRKPDGVTALITNTPLSRLGTATDILPHLPFVSFKHDELKVFGKGTPVVYINNRKITDLSEMDRINSNEVQSIKVITSPGAEYDATTNAVIRITTIRSADNGWSGSLTHRSTQDRQHSLYDQGNFNYRHGSFDLFGSLVYREPRSEYRQDNVSRYQDWEIQECRDVLSHDRKFNPSLGFNQVIASRHSLGMKYDFLYTPAMGTEAEDLLTALHNEQLTQELSQSDSRARRTNNHQLNAYYHWQIADGHTLQFDFDYANYRSHNYQQNRVLQTTQAEQLARSHQKAVNEMSAARLTYQVPVSKGLLKVGGEYADTYSDQRFSTWQQQTVGAISDAHSEADQSLSAGFLEYNYNTRLWTLVGGLRYESARFRYDDNGRRDYDASRNYSRLFPSAIVSYHEDDLQISLSYRALTQRPSYWMLRNNMAYNSPYQYEGGNPQLRSAIIQDLSLSGSWKDWTFNASCQRLSDIFGSVPELLSTTDSIVLYRPRNFSLIRKLLLSASYDAEIGPWNPCLEVMFHKQWLQLEGTHYNTPGWEFSWQNQCELPADILLGCDLNYSTRSYDGYMRKHQDLLLSIYLTRSFLDDRMRINLMFDNVLNTSRDRWSINYQGIYMDKDANYDERCLQLTVSYSFCKVRNKYRGRNASDEIKRL